VLSTHLHNDHSGLAGWLVRRFHAELWMSRTDFFMCKVMAADGPSDIPEDALRFYRRAGFTQEQLDSYRQRFGTFGARISPLPAGYRRVRDADVLEIDGREWRAVIGRGHAPEHVCLYCPELALLIAGDQVLPRITPNVSVNPSEPRANPLRDWLASCAHLKELLPADLLVLPAHEDPFFGLHTRLEQLIEFHQSGLQRLVELCATPRRSIDVFSALFKSPITEWTFFAATGESIAHLHYALERGQLRVEEDADGVAWYSRA
jgi:glyoxylase-like metal-dependent hydrolase (beta-lactamase superfamily II)